MYVEQLVYVKEKNCSCIKSMHKRTWKRMHQIRYRKTNNHIMSFM